MTPADAMRSGLWLPLFEELADPGMVASLAAEAEERGWHGVFVWDQLRWREPIRHVADPWITLAAIAAATEQVMLGPMVTPLARRRPTKVARETASLDVLSGGRLILGVGLGGDRFAGEFSKTGEELDDRVRGEMLDEALEILMAAWSGEPVNHRGRHYLVDDVQFLPRPVQRPRVPVWAAAFPGNVKPLRRAARYDGFFPVEPRERGSVRSGGRGRARPARRQHGALRHRRRAASRQRCRPLCRGRRHLVDDRVGTRGLA